MADLTDKNLFEINDAFTNSPFFHFMIYLNLFMSSPNNGPSKENICPLYVPSSKKNIRIHSRTP